MNIDRYDVIIIGGSYAGLSAGMALGRALRNVLIIDSGKPCNRQTPHSHNFLTQDGNTPAAIWTTGREQVAKYTTVQFCHGLAVAATHTDSGFSVTTDNGTNHTAKKLILATGVQDIMPPIPGFAACWGISVIHCPYCHGYEVRNEITGILANGDMGFEFSKLIHNWTKKLTLLTNGKCELSNEQINALTEHNIEIVEKVIVGLEHVNGHIANVLFADGTKEAMKAIYARVPFEQSSQIPQMLGCELTETGHIKVDNMQKTSVTGLYACGDNTTPMRTVSVAVSMGTMAGAIANSELIKDEF
jgi:prepilin-type processing-associated H-X9-DG protein